MGLRIALGSTRFSLKGIMIAEGVLLLTLIAIPALLICFNLHVSELTKGFYMDYTIARFVEGFFITYLVMGGDDHLGDMVSGSPNGPVGACGCLTV